MWYVLQVQSNSDDRVAASLWEHGFHARVLRENRAVRSDGAWTVKEYPLFPGYVFVDLDYNAENYYTVKAIPGVVQFLGTEGQPSPLTYMEAEWIRVLSGSSPDGEPLEPTEVVFQADGSVKILSGVLLNFEGRPIKYDKHSRRATLEISVGGQPKTVKLSIEPVKDTGP